MRSGRPPSEIDLASEHPGDMFPKFYIPRDERLTLVKIPGLEQKDAIETASTKIKPAVFALYSTQVEFQSMGQGFHLFKKGVSLSNVSKCASDLDSGREPQAETVTFQLPEVVSGELSSPLDSMSLLPP